MQFLIFENKSAAAKLLKRCGQTVKATELCLGLNCRFFQVVFRSLIVFYSKYKKSIKMRQEKECVFFLDLSSRRSCMAILTSVARIGKWCYPCGAPTFGFDAENLKQQQERNFEEEGQMTKNLRWRSALLFQQKTFPGVIKPTQMARNFS